MGSMTTRLTWPLWRPPDEALESVAAAIAAHWNAAKAYREHLFWPAAESWLRSAYHFTNGGKLIKYASGSASVLNPNFVPRS
jgi:hypothetical protein